MKAVGVETPLLVQGRYDFEALVDNYSFWLKATGFSYRHSKDAENKNNNNNRHTFIIQHDMGRNFSLYTAECSKLYFEPVVTKEVEYSITDNCVAITVQG